MKNRIYSPFYGCILCILCIVSSCSPSGIERSRKVDLAPLIFPDYSDVIFPSNIAAPNFHIQEKADQYYVEIGAEETVFFQKKTSRPSIVIPLSSWKKLINERVGKDFFIRIYGQKKGEWIRYKDIRNEVSNIPIDPYLVYRLLYPGYELWNQMGIYQRDLTSYQTKAVIENKSVAKGCVNCHTFAANSPSTMMFHIRGKMGGTLIHQEGNTRKVEIKDLNGVNTGTYSSWHPGGRYITLSSNNVNQYFHSTGPKAIEVSDADSDLIFFDTQTNEVFTDSAFYGPQGMETFPTWSPDGKTLYYCRANAIEHTTAMDSIHYDLYRISFQAENRSFGMPESVYTASLEGKSISHPRISPNGRYLMFCRFNYGTFSIWHPESQLCLLDLDKGDIRELDEVNSEDVDSYHSWSSTGDWFVFSSKRYDGLWAHPYISFFDTSTGVASKPFLVPQKDPSFYMVFTKTFNLPELITAPISY
ncbi:cytochrome C biosynthesis protein [Parabacteroides sp. 52]|uniref:TolB family protein n=1 Tax=unclassified Parabacteroides TaxID=2649774 RepID=UPI0013D4CE95|nr:MULTISPECIES: PD40 domain-containing protein [unclassified Parabacteroides]MDH6535231.1 hypothetical protein [Parabacteroides sp. PM5-20]NDV55629.1 cytochrome C biosynthesis protein [Parabacteroides sp. 52]